MAPRKKVIRELRERLDPDLFQAVSTSFKDPTERKIASSLLESIEGDTKAKIRLLTEMRDVFSSTQEALDALAAISKMGIDLDRKYPWKKLEGMVQSVAGTPEHRTDEEQGQRRAQYEDKLAKKILEVLESWVVKEWKWWS